jgi:hypothetical protein
MRNSLILSWVLILLSFGLLKNDSSIFSIIFLIDIWLLSHPHALITFFKTKTYLKFNKKMLITIFLITISCLSIVAYEKGSVGLYFIYFFWQWFHYFRQNYGISFSQLPKISPARSKFEYGMSHLMPLLAMLTLFSKGPLDFLGHYIHFFEMDSLNTTLHFLFILSGVVWLSVNIPFLLKNKNVKEYFISTGSSFLLYYFAYIYVDQFIYGWLGLTIYHNIQYLFFIFKDRDFIVEIFNKSRGVVFYFTITVVSMAFYGVVFLGTDLISLRFIPFALVTVFSLNIVHYIVDSFIWKSA